MITRILGERRREHLRLLRHDGRPCPWSGAAQGRVLLQAPRPVDAGGFRYVRHHVFIVFNFHDVNIGMKGYSRNGRSRNSESSAVLRRQFERCYNYCRFACMIGVQEC